MWGYYTFPISNTSSPIISDNLFISDCNENKTGLGWNESIKLLHFLYGG